MELSKRIRDLRYAKGWGPDELASRAKISRTALYQIERGNTSKPQAGTLRRISRALGVPLETLLDITPVTTGGDVPMAMEPAHEMGLGGGIGGGMPAPVFVPGRITSGDRANQLMEKFRVLLASPMAEGVARIVEESFRLLPIIPPPSVGDASSFAPVSDMEVMTRGRGRPRSMPAVPVE